MPKLRSHLLLLCGVALHEAFAFQALVVTKNPSIIGSRLLHKKPPTTASRSHQQAVSLSSSSSSSDDSTSFSSNFGRRRSKLSKDVVIIGGGLAGLSAALFLSQIDPDRHITILDKETIIQKPTSVASFAAAGMLAPQSERLPKGHYLDLCMASKRMYPDFADLVECMAREAGEEGAPYLVEDEYSDLEPWNIGYMASGGFLAPAFAGDNVATWAPPEDTKGTAKWLDATQVRELEPHVNPDVVGGWWFPEDASVDARRLTCSLRAACVGAGVQYLGGDQYEVSSLDLEEGNCKGLWLKNGKYFSTKSILVANGAWMRTLLPVPLEPHKGQSISLRMPKDRPPLLRRVLFAQDSYIVPKADGRIVIGATVEAGSFDPNVTPAGIMHILSYALQLVPGLADLPIEETWAGLRPTTPDKSPILGETPWQNLYLAGGYWRNGVLLAPKTGELMASLIAGRPLSDTDQAYLKAFSWDRFTSPGGGSELSVNMRYAASMYPIHTRKSGVGVSAAVGTELGSYSTAVSARDERRKDRESLFGDTGDEGLERAAAMGKQDGSAFSFGDKDEKRSVERSFPAPERADDDDDETKTIAARGLPQSSYLQGLETSEDAEIQTIPAGELPRSSYLQDLEDLEAVSSVDAPTYVPYGGSPDAFTVGYTEDEDNDLQSMYASIRENKSKQQVELEQDQGEERPDPGFRIYHIDEETGKHREVPPYTHPGAFFESIEQENQTGVNVSSQPAAKQEPIVQNGVSESYSETTYDGYQDIIEANADESRELELNAMREARRKNRVGQEVIDEEDLHL